MKAIGNLLLAILGIILISFSLKLIIIDKSDEYAQIIGGVVFGLLMTYPSVKKYITFKNKRFIKDILLVLLGVIFIAFSLKLIIIDKSDEYAQIVGGVVFGLFLIYPIFKKDTTTYVEKFIENQNIEVVIWWKRLVGFIIDYTVIILLGSVIAMLILPLITSLLNINNSDDIGFVFWVLFLIIFIFYYIIQEYFFKTTIGKLAFKLKIVSAKTNIYLGSEKAKNPTLFQIFVRTIVRLLFFIDIFFFLFKRPIGLHDIISKTIVIKK